MNRQFHSKASFTHYALLAVLLSVAIYFAWHIVAFTRQVGGLLIAVDLLIMLMVIQRIVHTTYTITSERTLVIDKGKLSRIITIPLNEIDRIDRINRWRIAGKPLISSLVIVRTSGQEYYISPKNEEDFIKCIIQRKQHTQEEEEE
ncbi:MAG: hypothetical protein GXY64_01080 [Bacteroidales bacterium]|mgnify:CR=1 FL=1|nr:hypothetical protein [Bacteroidales bacterium]